MRRLLFILVVLAWAAGGRATAADLKVPGGKDLPKVPATVPGTSNEPQKVWLAYGGFKPLAEPDKPNDRAGGPLAFLKEFGLAGDPAKATDKHTPPLEVRVNGQPHCLLVEVDGVKVAKHIGWVDKRHLILKEECLETESKLHRKAMVVRTVEDIKKGGHEGKFYDNPQLSGTHSESHNLHHTFFVYADTDPDDPKEGALLLGTSPRFTQGKPDGTVFGWGSKAALCQWNTREGVEFNTDTFPARAKNDDDLAGVYATMADAKKALKPDTRKEVTWLLREPFRLEKGPGGRDERKPFVYGPDIMRVVVLNKYEHLKPTLYEVGIPGGLYDAKGVMTLPADQAEQLKLEMARLQQGMDKIEIVFVVGCGSYADGWFARTQQLVDKITASAVDKGKPANVRVGLVVYGHKPKKASDPEFKMVPLTAVADGGHKKVRGGLEEIEFDEPKSTQPVLGAVTAAADMEFDHTVYGRKLVVVFGHFGDAADKGSVKFKSLAKKFAGDNRPTPIELLTVHLKSAENKGDDPGLFQSQMKALTEELAQLTKMKPFAISDKFIDSYTSVDTQNDVAVAEGKILKRYETIKEQQLALRRTFEEAQREGTDKIMTGALSDEAKLIAADALKIAKANGLKPLSEGKQVFHTGFVWENALVSKEVQLRRRILVNLKELEVVAGAVAGIRDQPPGQKVSERIRAGVAALVKGQTGYAAHADEPPDQALARAKGLNFFSPLLQRHLSETEKTSEEIEGELQNIYHRGYLLEDIGLGVKFDYTKKGLPVNGFHVDHWVRGNVPTTFPRDFPLGGVTGRDAQFKWYWIDFDKEWP